ncbi:hypothetical protein [Saccharothrix obliqua]|uniref:hypothetical protein n=1 Tax=Saccharothrix obliqua TaxID=2861747 RepID=UPI001C5E5DA4|nr:hypothetical protein [Saccharothrix obliqua]MBW4718172.1 hypothetical protein [Saccharothrix obliqua]
MSGGRGDGTPLRNPFSTMAVSRIVGFGEDLGTTDVTVETDAIRRAVTYLTEYLDAPPAERGGPESATVMLILGEHGSGKSHLARHLVRLAGARLSDETSSLHIEATADDVLHTYQRLLLQVGLDRVRARVNEFYADIVAEQLQDTGLASNAVELLRRREIEPRSVVRQLQLMESQLLRRVHRKLHDVTADARYGQALSLLLRPGFETAVWNWLTGLEPEGILVERGIATPIATDTDVLEAMGVLALLFGGERRRFLLVVDEFDKIFSAARDADRRVVPAFQEMLEVFTRAGACLVLCGHPDFVDMLDSSTVERVTHTVRMAGLSAAQVEQFVRLAQEAEFGSPRLEPFSVETAAYVAALTGGNPRKVIRMCHALYRMAHESPEGRVTDEMVRETARDQLGSLSTDEVVQAARRVLLHNGWTYQPDHYLALGRDSRVDFWLTFEDRTGGCAVVFTDSVLTEQDFTAVHRRTAAVRKAVPVAEVVVVVNGVVAVEPAARLRQVLGREPLVYSGRGFAEDFRAAVRAAARLLPGDPRRDPMGGVGQRIDQINRQQSSLYDFVEQLADHLDVMRTSSDRRLDAIQQHLAALDTGPGRVGAPSADPALPPEVARLFSDGLAALEEITQTELMVREAFDSAAPDVLEAAQRRQGSAGYLEAVGIAALLRQALLSFRDTVLRWYRTEHVPRFAEELPPSTADSLDEICRTYDAVVEYLPLHRLEPLVQLPPWSSRGGVVSELTRSTRRARLWQRLDNLSLHVRDTLVRAALSGQG